MLWGRTFLLAVISIRMISHTHYVSPVPKVLYEGNQYRPRFATEEAEGQKEHGVLTRLLIHLSFKPCPCKVPCNLEIQGALKCRHTSSLPC